MTIQQIIDEQMKEFDFSFYPDLVEMHINYRDSRKNITVATIDDFKSFISSYTRNLIEAVGEEIIGKDQREAELGYAVVILGKEENKLRAKQRAKLKEIINSLK